MIKKFLLLFICFSVILSSFCGCSLFEKKDDAKIKGGDIEESSVVTPTAPRVEYDYKNLEASKELDTEEKHSYYISLLDERTKLTYDEIYKDIKNCKNEIIITRNISEENFNKIMNIIIFDTPELFHVSKKYKYLLDGNGNVSKLFPIYLLTKKEYDLAFQELDDWAVSFSTRIKNSKESSTKDSEKITQYDAEIEIIKSVFRPKEKTFFSKNEAKQSGTILIGTGSSKIEYDKTNLNVGVEALGIKYDLYNSESMSKAFCYVSRKTGLEVSCVIGELTDESIKSIKGRTPAFVPPATSIVKKSDGLLREVSINDCFYYWNIIKINDQWHNVDTYYQNLLSFVLKEKMEIDHDFMPFINMSDDYSCASRLAYYSEDLLGKLPSCTSITFMHPYRNGLYFPQYNASQMTIAINELLITTVSNKSSDITIQFANQDNFDNFINQFPKLLDKYNEENKKPIRDYSLSYNSASFSVIVSQIKYN